nr:membrane-bound lytic murein transglycosylase A [Raoultella sp. NCTC 9187]
MKGCWAKYVATGAILAMLAGCSSKPTDRGQQYNEGSLPSRFPWLTNLMPVGTPINAGDFSEQVRQIRSASPRLYNSQSNVYNSLQQWLSAGGDTRTLSQYGIDAWQMQGRR